MKRIRLEHENKISNITTSISGTEDEDRSSIWHILVLTLAPLYLLIIIGAIILGLIMLDRHSILLTNFVLQQAIFIVILIVGMAVAIIFYALAVMNRTQKNWHVATKWSNKAGERGTSSIGYCCQYHDTPNNNGIIFSLTSTEKVLHPIQLTNVSKIQAQLAKRK